MTKKLLVLCTLVMLSANAYAEGDSADYSEQPWKFGLRGNVKGNLPLVVEAPCIYAGFVEYKITDGLGVRTEIGWDRTLDPVDDKPQPFWIYMNLPMIRWYPEKANHQLSMQVNLYSVIHRREEKVDEAVERKKTKLGRKLDSEEKSKVMNEAREWVWKWKSYIYVGVNYEFTNGFELGVEARPFSGVSFFTWSYNFAKLF